MENSVKKKMEIMLGSQLMSEVPHIAQCAQQAEQNKPKNRLRSSNSNEADSGICILSVDVLYDRNFNKMICEAWLLSKIQMEFSVFQIELLQKGQCIGQNTLAEVKQETIALQVEGTPVNTKEELSAGDISIRISILNKGRADVLKTASLLYEVDYLMSFEDAIDNINVEDPGNKKTPKDTTIHVSFDRKFQLQNLVDYDYTDYLDTSNEQPIYLDMSGTIYFKDKFEYVEGSYKTDRIFLRKGNHFYEYKQNIPPTITVVNDSRNIISYKYNSFWNDKFPKNVEGTNTLQDYRLSATLRYTEGPGTQEKTTMIVISSREYLGGTKILNRTPSNYRKVPRILFYWGCIEENTQIRMSDESLKRIKDISLGELIKDMSGRSCQVADVIKGEEEKLFCISTTGSKEILVTQDHPFMTKKGEKAAIELAFEDELLMENENYERIESAYPIEKHFTVYSLMLNPSSYFYGNGFAIGDSQAQGRICKELQKKNDYSVSQDIVKECGIINSALNKTYGGE